MERVLFGLGIRHIGEKAAKILSETFHHFDALMQATKEELTESLKLVTRWPIPLSLILSKKKYNS